MKFGAVISAVTFGAMLGASPVSASVVDLHTLRDGNTFSGNGHIDNSLSHSSTTTDKYVFNLSSPTGASSLTIFDGFLGFSSVTLELFSLSGPSPTELSPSVTGSDPLVLRDSDLKNGSYELKVIDILPPATEEEIGRNKFKFPSSGGYVLDFVDPPVSPVPEPSTWAMMMLGFCGLAFLMHRRRTAGKALAMAT